MSSPSPLMELVGRVAFEAARLRPFLPTYLHLLVSALFPIYAGAHASLSIPSSAAPPTTKKETHDDLVDEEPEVVADRIEGLSPKDAILFPLLAGLTLSSLYFIIKWLEDPSILNKVLSYYFLQVGLVFGMKFFKDSFTVMRSVCFPNQYAQDGLVWRVNREKQRINEWLWRTRHVLYAKSSLNFHIHKIVTLKVPVGVLDALAISTSTAIVSYFTFVHKPWYISNLIGFAFCYGSTQYMSLTTFWTGTLLLSALFFYDIYFVFFTPMMVTVATNLDIPIKLLFPRPPGLKEAEKGTPSLAMLGLGDIVIPGIMMALALRFDLYLFYLRQTKQEDGKTEKPTYVPVTGGWGERLWVGRSAALPDLQAKAFPKTYFKASLTGYTLGMIVTLLVMQVAQHAQPALLYLVPGVLGALWGTATIKGDLKEMWGYTEEKEDDKAKDATKGKGNAEQNKVKGTGEDSSGQVKSIEAGGESSKDERPSQSEELSTTSATSDENSNRTPSTKDDSSSPSESSSGSDAETKPPSKAERRKSPKPEVNQPRQEEQNSRHLIWFSLDFPPPFPHPTDQRAPVNSSTATQERPSEPNDSEEAKKGGEPAGESTESEPGAVEGEPPGKRRRVE